MKVFGSYIYLNNFSNMSFVGEINGNDIESYPNSEVLKLLSYDTSSAEILFIDTKQNTLESFNLTTHAILKMQLNIDEQIGVTYFNNNSLIFSAIDKKGEIKWYQALLQK